ncbi:MAG: glycosyltransferase, partial [Pseudomonadota bacterium]
MIKGAGDGGGDGGRDGDGDGEDANDPVGGARITPFRSPSGGRQAGPSDGASTGTKDQASAGVDNGHAPILLDISRSVKRLRLPRQTGIDRVESAYLEWAVARPAGAWLLAGIGARQYLVPPANAPRLAADLAGIAGEDGGLSSIDSGAEDAMGPDSATNPAVAPAPAQAMALDWRGRLAFWRDQRVRMGETAVRRAAVASAPATLLPLRRLFGRLPAGTVALNVGHENLSATLIGALHGVGLRNAVMIHDLIPITHPEYSRPAPAARFAERLDAALMADLLIANSRATAAAVSAHAAAHDYRLPPLRVLPLGIKLPESLEDAAVALHAAWSPAPPAPAEPSLPASPAGHFVMLGTIEGRKNHLLLMALWRGLSDAGTAETVPHLHIVGRRGWAAGQVFDMLDRSPMMGRTVFEHPDLDDAAVISLVSSARALLLPSFVEGYGLPLGEALAAGVPVIAADLPA